MARVAEAAAKQAKRVSVPEVADPIAARCHRAARRLRWCVVLWEECDGEGLTQAVRRLRPASRRPHRAGSRPRGGLGCPRRSRRSRPLALLLRASAPTSCAPRPARWLHSRLPSRRSAVSRSGRDRRPGSWPSRCARSAARSTAPRAKRSRLSCSAAASASRGGRGRGRRGQHLHGDRRGRRQGAQGRAPGARCRAGPRRGRDRLPGRTGPRGAAALGSVWSSRRTRPVWRRWSRSCSAWCCAWSHGRFGTGASVSARRLSDRVAIRSRTAATTSAPTASCRMLARAAAPYRLARWFRRSRRSFPQGPARSS